MEFNLYILRQNEYIMSDFLVKFINCSVQIRKGRGFSSHAHPGKAGGHAYLPIR